MVKNISKSISGKCSQKSLDNAKESTTDVLKTASKKNAIQERAEATIDLIENEFGEKFTENISVSAPWTVPSKTKGIEFDDENIQRKTHIARKKH